MAQLLGLSVSRCVLRSVLAGRRVCALLVLFAASVFSTPIHAQPAVLLDQNTQHIELNALTEYWIDNSKNTAPSDIQAREIAGTAIFKLSKASDVHHLNGGVLWFRFTTKNLDALSQNRSRWLIEMSSPTVDDVQLHWRDEASQWLSLRAGDVVPRKLWPIPTRMPTFALQGSYSGETQYYLRVENARFPVSLPLHIYRDAEYLKSHLAEQMLLGALVGMLIITLFASSSTAYVRREQAFAAYTVYLLALGLFNLTNTGLTALYVWNESPLLADRANYVFAAITSAFGPTLVYLIVQPVIRVRAILIAIALHAMIMLTCASLELLYPSVMSYRLLNFGILSSIALVSALIMTTWQRREPISRWVALCFAPVALSAMPLLLRNVGAIPNSWLTQYSVPIATMIELPLLLYALFARSNLRRETLARTTGLPSKDALTGLPNMSHFLQQMNGSITRAHRFKHSYGLLLVELLNYDWFLKEHGQEIANRAIILTSSRLQQQVRDVDTVCRLDASNFVILIEGACNARQLTKLAARLSASGLSATEILPVGASLRLSICCGLLPTESSQEVGDDANAQLGWLIAAAEATPSEQRKLVRSIGF